MIPSKNLLLDPFYKAWLNIVLLYEHSSKTRSFFPALKISMCAKPQTNQMYLDTVKYPAKFTREG